MESKQAFCPQCKKDTTFYNSGKSVMCGDCGFKYDVAVPPLLGPAKLGKPGSVMGLLKVLTIVGVVMAGLVVIGLAVVFVGCAYIMRGF